MRILLKFIAVVSAGPSLLVTVTNTATMAASDFPLYSVQSANPTTVANYGSSGYACIRNGNTYVFPQTKSGGAVITGNTQTFYPTIVGKLGQVTVSGNVLADNSGCCPAAQSTYSNCPVGLNSGDAKVTGRVAYGPGAVSASYDYYGFNQDFILASTYQDSYTGLGDRADAPLNYCDQQVTALTGVSWYQSEYKLTTKQGFTGLTKCTYFVNVSPTKGAPAFKLSQAHFTKFQLHYVEWASSEMKFIPETSASPGFFGGPATPTPNTYPMPISTVYPVGATGADVLSWTYNGGQNNYQSNLQIPGSIGPVSFYPWVAGPFQEDQKVTVDTTIFFQQIEQAWVQDQAYRSQLATYNSLKSAYENKLKEKELIASEWYAQYLLPKVVLPERPCAPTLPAAYQGPSIDYWTGPGASDISHTAQEKNNTFKAKKYGWLGRTAVGSSINSGFIMASNDTAVNSAANLMFSGHTFGLYGQGQASMPQNGTAFEFNVDLHNAASAVQNTHSMMISLFPYDGTDQGLGAGQTITLQVSAVSWRGDYSLSAPPTPPAPAALPDVAGSSMLTSLPICLLLSLLVLIAN